MADKQLAGINEFLFEGVLEYSPKVFDMKNGSFVVFSLTQERKMGKNDKIIKTYMDFVSFRENVRDDLLQVFNKARIRVKGILAKGPDKRFPNAFFVKLLVDSMEVVEDLNEAFGEPKSKKAKDEQKDVVEVQEQGVPENIETLTRRYETSIGKKYSNEEIAKDPYHPKYEMMKRAFDSIKQRNAKPTPNSADDPLAEAKRNLPPKKEVVKNPLEVNDDDLPF
jgi:hypothetical protein